MESSDQVEKEPCVEPSCNNSHDSTDNHNNQNNQQQHEQQQQQQQQFDGSFTEDNREQQNHHHHQPHDNLALNEQHKFLDPATTTFADVDSDDELEFDADDDFESFSTPYEELERDRSRSLNNQHQPSSTIGSSQSPLPPSSSSPSNINTPLSSSKKKRQQEEYMRRVEVMKTFVDNEWKLRKFEGQVQRDAETWLETLRSPGVEARGNILRRLFTVLRYGGLILRHSNSKDSNPKDTQWRSWYTTGWPIATALSHGGRIIVQLPKRPSDSKSKFDSHFWKWLVAGDDGQLSDYISTSTNGDQCAREKKLIFKRLGATHGLEFEKPLQDTPTTGHSGANTNNYNNSVNHNGKIDQDAHMYPPLPNGRRKVLVEAKTSGFNLRDTKMLRGDRHTLKYHRHWGMNIPLGGHMNRRMTIKTVRADGCNGHVYMYRMPATETTYGGIMVGVEGSEWGKYDAVGGYHGVSAKSSPYSPTYGYKWHSKNSQDLSEVGGPGKYDCMYIDLSSGWEYLKELYINDWRDEYVTQTSIPLPSDPCYKEFLENMENVVQPRVLTRQRLSKVRRNLLRESLKTRHAGKFEASDLHSMLTLYKSRYVKIKANRPYITYEDAIARASNTSSNSMTAITV